METSLVTNPLSSFDQLKRNLTPNHVLKLLGFAKEFVVILNASGMLTKKYCLVTYASKN